LLGKLEAGQVEEVKPSVLAQQLGLPSDAIDTKGAKQTAGAPKLRLKTKSASQNAKSANRNKHKQQRPRRP
jgi:hypothetical protein